MADQQTVVQVKEASRGPRGPVGVGAQGPQGIQGPQGPAGDVAKVATIAALTAIPAPAANFTRIVLEPSRIGIFVFDSSDLSAAVAIDTAKGMYAAPDGQNGSAGAWVRQITGWTIEAGWFAPAADGVTDDRAVLAVADAVATYRKNDLIIRSPHRVATSLTFSSQVLFNGAGLLKPDAAATVTFNKGYIADDWQQIGDLSAGGKFACLRAARGYHTPQHFGADPLNTAVDDRPGIEAATELGTLNVIRTEYAVGFPVKFPSPGVNNYYLTKTRPIYVARTTHWYSDVKRFGATSGGTTIRAANGLPAVVFCFSPGGSSSPAEYKPENDPAAAVPGIGKLYSGGRSLFQDLLFLPESGATVRQGFVSNTVVFMDRCGGSGFTEAGCHLHAQTSGCIINAFAAPGIENAGNTSTTVPASTVAYDGSGAVWGNVNGSRLTDCSFHNGVAAAGVNGGSYGIVLHGNNAGTVCLINPYCNGNQGAGILENTSIGTSIISHSTAGNCWKVSNGGSFYICIKYHVAAADKEPGVGANWRTYWAQNTATVADSAWAVGQVYHPCGSVNVCIGASYTTVTHGYSEGGIEVGIIARAATTVSGGIAATRTPWHGEFSSARVIITGGGSPSTFGYKAFTDPGNPATEYGIALGTVSGYTGGKIIGFGDGRDDPVNLRSAIQLRWNQNRGRYEFIDNSGGSNNMMFGFTGAGFTGTGYTGVAQAFPWANGLYIADGTSVGNYCVRVRAALRPSSLTDATYGAAIKGDVWIFVSTDNPGDPLMARCITAGTLGSTAVLEYVYANPKISVGTAAPSTPAVGQLWVDTN